MDLKQLQQKTVAIDNQFPHKFDKVSLALDLVEEVGELAQAILITEKIKITNDPAKKRTVDDVANALGDIMFDLLALAEKYGLDMESEYVKVMEEVAGRIGKGEFDRK
jgi:NTP pyrophosphatase (non-canonical NTP hydrolase)